MKPQEDWSDFFQEMADVKPLKQDKIVKTHSLTTAIQSEQRRKAAAFTAELDDNILTNEFVEPVDPYDQIGFKRDGVQEGVYRKLRLGKYTIDACLNLHHKSVNEARSEVFLFIKDCYQKNIRSLLIIHGIGINSKPYPAILKSHINKWLPALSSVLAFHTAQKIHGGYGATYVLLRKSEDKKRENRDRHLNRRA